MMMTKERLDELDRLVSDAIADCQYYGLAENHVLEFWRGAKLIVDKLKMGLIKMNPGEQLQAGILCSTFVTNDLVTARQFT